MTDTTSPTPETPTPQRIFMIGTTRIVADETTAGLDAEGVRAFLRPSFPEVAHATVRERTLEDGTHIVDFLPRPGRKG